MSCFARTRRRAQSGSALVEFAISFSVVWLLFSGVYSFGYSLYIYNRLQTAVANAVQLGATWDYDSSNASTYTTAIRNMVLYGDTSTGTSPIVPNLSASHVLVSIGTDAKQVPRDVQVSVSGYSIKSVFQTIVLTGKPRAITRYTGRWLCSAC